ncbi:MAG TPA: septation ring formation regulator EzrA, partial [Massilibacterium sp.]|nr:septation ring formation regulator EzrA [Massilibacterium sp.]
YEAKQKLKAMRHKMIDMSRSIQIHHLPGVSSEYELVMERTKVKLDNIKRQLEEKPLQMEVIHRLLEEAEEMVNILEEQTHETIEQVQLFERLVQYGNRYRRKSKEFSNELDQAEQLFRECKYEEALEKAAMSIERVSPGSIQQLEVPLKK